MFTTCITYTRLRLRGTCRAVAGRIGSTKRAALNTVREGQQAHLSGQFVDAAAHGLCQKHAISFLVPRFSFQPESVDYFTDSARRHFDRFPAADKNRLYALSNLPDINRGAWAMVRIEKTGCDYGGFEIRRLGGKILDISLLQNPDNLGLKFAIFRRARSEAAR